jgi:cytochrome c oxidase subunit 2
MARVIVGFLAVSTVILFVFLIGDFVVGRKVFSTPPRDPVMIKVTGHQWWWEFQYEHVPGEEDAAQNIFTTANELHIPVGTPVFLKLDSVDVIHSFWVPNLNGKKDLIPGQPTSLWLQADRPGTYYGQCAEYCGAQHAHMRIVVTAEPDADFRKWLAASRQLSEPPPRPAAGAEPDSVRRGYEVFTSQRPSSCLVCHTIDGTAARGRVGPNLSHLASRTTIGAGALEFNRENLRRWISDPQKIKPGVNMPPNPLSDADMNALLDYLETQK